MLAALAQLGETIDSNREQSRRPRVISRLLPSASGMDTAFEEMLALRLSGSEFLTQFGQQCTK